MHTFKKMYIVARTLCILLILASMHSTTRVVLCIEYVHFACVCIILSIESSYAYYAYSLVVLRYLYEPPVRLNCITY